MTFSGPGVGELDQTTWVVVISAVHIPAEYEVILDHRCLDMLDDFRVVAHDPYGLHSHYHVGEDLEKGVSVRLSYNFFHRGSLEWLSVRGDC